MKIEQNISLKDKNWFKTGGNSKFYCEPKNNKDFSGAIKFANQNSLEIFILGKGANLLISDEGFDSLTIHPKLKKISKKKEYVTAQAGVEIQELIDFCLDHDLIGLEDFSNIPGTIGGAIYINVHYFNKFISDYLTKAQIIDKKTGQIFDVEKSWFKFSYDNSKLQNQNYFLLNATFKLEKTNKVGTAYAKGKRDEIIRYRNRQYPTSNTCGSFFRNFHDDEVTLTIDNKKMIFVAYYLDKLGIKGNLKIGDAQVSYKHANMFVTGENAKSIDVINLAKKVQELMIKKFGILPQAECQFIGFKKYPLK